MTKEPREIIEKVALPAGSLVASLALGGGFTDHADAFRAAADPVRFPDVDAFARAFLEGKPPAWIDAAMRARDAIVGTLFGLKTSAADDAQASRALVPGTRHGIFRLFERTATEILLGEDDRHLDFRVSVLHERVGDEAFVTVSTIVRFNNAWGRAYFLPVRPVHGRVVPAMMRRVIA
jgi:Protein of unknown function (DUF2867)